MKEVLILGSGGWIPTKTRQTCSYVYRTKKTLILLDAGSGLSNLYKYPNLLEEYETINLILSHYHIDHLVGLSYLLNWLKKEQKLNIWGPGYELYGKKCENIISSFIGYPFFSRAINKYTNQVSVNDYSLKPIDIDGMNISFNKQEHSDPSYGIKIDDVLHYATDTSVLNSTFEISQNVKLLLHECWSLTPDNKSKHSSLEEIIKKSQAFDIKRIGLIHINPNWSAEDEKEIQKKISLMAKPNIFISKDNTIFNLNK